MRMLTLAPVKVFDKQKLTPKMGDQLLSLIDPTLTDLTGVQGTISLSLDTFRVPLGVPKDEFVKKVELSGKLHLHEITIIRGDPADPDPGQGVGRHARKEAVRRCPRC